MSKKRLVVIDGKSVFYRGYYAMPNLATKDGTPTGGVYGFAVMALEVIKKMNPDYICVAWDKPKTNIRRRREIYPEYKANRKPAPPDFYEQIPILHELLQAFGFPFYEIDDHEADDIMASFARQSHEKGFDTVLISSDHDLLQLISDDITVAALKKGLTNIENFDPQGFEERYQMTPEQFVDYKSLRGDPSDNIPGVAGVGEKTATQLIADYGSLDGVYEHLDEIKETLRKKLEAGKENAYITKQLVLLDDKVPLDLEWDKAAVANLDPKKVVSKLRELEFRTLINQLPEQLKVDMTEIAADSQADIKLGEGVDLKIINSEKELKDIKIRHSGNILVHTFTSGEHNTGLENVLISDNAKSGYLLNVNSDLTAEQIAKNLGEILEDPKVDIISYSTKDVIKAFGHLDKNVGPVGHDIRMAAFLINSLQREQSITSLVQNEFGYEGNDLDNIPPEEREHVSKKLVSALWALYKNQTKTMREDMPKVQKLAQDIEWPIIPVLARMELEGVKLDSSLLNKMSKDLEVEISDLMQEIYGYADEEFNVSSPAQLSKILFEKLKLSTNGVKKNKSGYSTAAKELDKLRGLHPIIDLISKYREHTKLKSTYVDTLPSMVDENGRLHTTFSLAVAASGRLSSHDPNLQNIPIRTELGKRIRDAFIASEGKTLVSADYSQFELRLAAVIAGDDELIESFNDGLDVHARTAAQVYGKAIEDVTKDERRDAKVINFGILYGMSPHGLSNATGMTQKDAKDFIDRYFKLRQPLLDYMEETKKQAKEQGYVETMFGRRRPTPDAKSSNFVVRQSAERAAINHPIQGSEADLMKMAMIEVDKKLPVGAKQLLQIHDSILVECDVNQKDEISKILKDTMENIYKLPVKLDVDVSSGQNWGEL